MASSVIYPARTISGNQPLMDRIIEEASQTFLAGTPVEKATDGGIAVWDGTTVAAGIAGISSEAASNLTTLGVAKTLTFGSVPYETSAVNIPRGAPLNDGKIGFFNAVGDTIFHGEVGPSQTPVVADVGKQYGMTLDSDGHWYVDRTKVTAGTNTVVIIIALDANDPRGVYFVFLASAVQIPG